jgi:predicted MFS family arabinose efflux permease
MLFALPFLVQNTTTSKRDAGETSLNLRDAISEAFGHHSFLLLVAGFFVCGFQLAFITVHLPPYLAEKGLSSEFAGFAMGLIGLFNVAGSYTAGIIGGKGEKRFPLSVIYLLRSASLIAFLLLPVTQTTTLIFTASMGFLWLSTVPLTMGLITVMFGTRYMATLYGFVFFSHQVGSFLGVWLGGKFYDLYGSYDLVWWSSVALGVFAAIVHLPIRELRAPKFA